MTCDIDNGRLRALARGSLPGDERDRLLAHVDRCDDCRAALRGAEALAALAARETGGPPAGLFEAVVEKAASEPVRAPRDNRFWLGAGFGGAIAASLLALALVLGWIGPAVEETGQMAEFVVTLGEPRNMDIAIETGMPLDGASISVLLSGGVELDGYDDRRELTWTTDLEAGINRLSLPVVAIDPAGGKMVVRLDHPDSEQVFVVRLKTKA